MGSHRSVVACLLSALLAALTVAVISTGSTSVAAVACDSAPLANAPTVKVLVIGDSLSQGFAGDFTWRYRLWQAERAKGVNIDFVGPYPSLMGWGSSSAANELYADPCFTEREHLAIGGKAMEATLVTGTRFCPDGTTVTGTEVAWATYCYQPDVVVGFMGYNDLKSVEDKGLGRTAEQVLATAKALIAEVRAARPGTPVAMATVAGTKAPQVLVDATAYNARLASAVQELSTLEEPVGLIDITREWKGSPDDTWDGYHPNANGEMHLAWDVAAGLHGLGLVPALDHPIPVQPLGPRIPGVLTVSSRTATSVTLSWTLPGGADRQVLYQRDLTADTSWTKVQDLPYSTSARLTELPAHRLQFRLQAAKGTSLAEAAPGSPLYSEVLEVDLRGPSPSPSSTPSSSQTPSQTPSSTPSQTPSSTPSQTPDGVPTPTPSSTATPTSSPTVLARVEALTLMPGYHRVTMTWRPVPGATGYVVIWRKSGAGVWSYTTAAGVAREITGLVAGQSYDFAVRADSPRQGSYSTIIAARPTGMVPSAPPRPAVKRLSGHRIKVVWNPSSGATRYQIQFRVKSGAWKSLAFSTSTRYTTRALVKGRSYGFRIRPYHQLVAGKVSFGSRISAG